MFWQQSFTIDCCIIDSAITFFSENGALNAPTPPEAFFLTSPVTHENWHLDVMATICHNRLMQYWFNHHIFFWKWRSKCFNSTRSPLSHKPSDGQNSTFIRRFLEQIVAIDWCIIDSIITIFFLENGASKTLFPTNPVTREKLLKDVLTTNCWMPWSLKISKRANFVHFVSRPLGENVPKDLFWQKWAF